MATVAVAAPAVRPIPNIEELPLVGSMQRYNRDRLGFVLALSRAYGDAAQFHFGPFPVVFFNTGELIHEVLVKRTAELETGEVRRNAFGPVIGNGLFVSEGEL